MIFLQLIKIDRA